MDNIPKYLTSVQIDARKAENLNISIGFEGNGSLRLCFQDTAELGQDSIYINDTAFPNTGIFFYGMHSMWLSMFVRHLPRYADDED